ncbi:hypothetical protein FDENT_705 [Fusarium denticulatum]|uniref:Uncharacterized protein n=1 Tax=Fusarium denticulatum TaxID=48507 RepID=A0A8H5XJK2_9HYPO|nr:hypothetical protein FDENT_705 [Fusarium denticulatum]
MDDHSAADQSRSPPRKRPKTVHFPGEDCNADSVHMHDTESREVEYCDAIHKECSGMEMDLNNRFIYVVPEKGAVVFFQGMNQAAATLDKDYMAKACEMVTFQFDSSRTMRLFAKLLKKHFENHGGVVPRVHAKILVFESASFAEAPVLNR